MPAATKPNRYAQIIERVFLDNYRRGSASVEFTREEFKDIAAGLKIRLPDNLGDILYSFRYRYELPRSVLAKQPKGLEWAIFPAGQRPTRYRFAAVPSATVIPAKG